MMADPLLKYADAGDENNQMLSPQWIWIHYGPILASITGRSSEKVMVMLLHLMFHADRVHLLFNKSG